MKPTKCFAIATSILLMTFGAVSAQEEAAGNPLGDVTQEMKLATNHLSKKTTDKQTQQPQADAVSKLDKLIAELEKEKMNLGTGINPNPSTPATSSTIRNGPGGMGDLHGAKEQGNRWGDLPAHERDRILQSLTEGFPAHYQAILEAYYKRLAVEKKAEEGDAAPRDAASKESNASPNESKAVVKPAAAKMSPAGTDKTTPSAKKVSK
jgi:hypothetical protein